MPDCYLVLSDEALRLAAVLWEQARQQGRPTSDNKSLDTDVILAAQALSLGENVVIATTNRKHLAPFVAARDWTEIFP